MQTPNQVLDSYFLDSRCMLVELAATLDRYDRAVGRGGPGGDAEDPRLAKLYDSLAVLASRDTSPDRAERLLMLFSDPA